MKIFVCAILILPAIGFARLKHGGVAEIIDEATISAPLDNEVCFSPDGHCDVKLYKFLQTAKKSVEIAIYDINLDQLVHEILVLSKKIPVRIVVDARQAKGNHSSVGLLQKAGAEVRFGHQRGIMHDKFMIIDGTRLETGSFNYTNHASVANQENQIYISNAEVVRKYKERFEKMWSTGKF